MWHKPCKQLVIKEKIIYTLLDQLKIFPSKNISASQSSITSLKYLSIVHMIDVLIEMVNYEYNK